MFINKQGFSLSELVITMAVLLILSSLTLLAYFVYIDNSKINQMKANADNLESAVLYYYENYGDFPKGEQVIITDTVKSMIYNSSGGKCTNNIRGSIILRPGKEILKEGKVYSGSYEYTVDLPVVDFDIKAYEINKDGISRYMTNLTKNKLDDYLVIDCSHNTSDDKDNVVDVNCGVLYKCIYDAEDLYNIRSDLKGNYLLKNDIDLSSYGNWEPIGYATDISPEDYQKAVNYILDNYNMTLDKFTMLPESDKELLLELAYRKLDIAVLNEFEGRLDGNGYEITGLKINTIKDNRFIGLFFAVRNAEIKNLTVRGMDVDVSSIDRGMDSPKDLIGGALAPVIINSIIEDVELRGKIKLDVRSFIGISDIKIGGLASVVENSYIKNVESYIDYETTLGCTPINHPNPSEFTNLFSKFILVLLDDSEIINSGGYGERFTFDVCN